MAPLTVVAALALVLAAGLGWRAGSATRRAAARRRLAELGARPDSGQRPGAVTGGAATPMAWRAGCGRQGQWLPGVLEDVARGVRRLVAAPGVRRRRHRRGSVGRCDRAGDGRGRADRGTPLATALARWATVGATTDERLAAGAARPRRHRRRPAGPSRRRVAATLRERRSVAAEIRAQ